MSTLKVTLNSQVIQVLCLGIFQESNLLSALQTKFPSSSWTDTLLASTLLTGSREGRYLLLATNPNYWQLRYDMVLVNAANQVFQPFCAAIKTVYYCNGTTSAV